MKTIDYSHIQREPYFYCDLQNPPKRRWGSLTNEQKFQVYLNFYGLLPGATLSQRIRYYISKFQK